MLDNEDIARKNKFLINSKSFNSNYWSLFAASVYLLNPYGWSSCVSQSTAVIHNSVILLWLFFLLNGSYAVSLVFLAIHSHITVYSATLIFSTISFILQKECLIRKINQSCFTRILKYSLIFMVLLAAVFYANLFLENFNFRFIQCTYMFILNVPDLIPNLGLFWYFFTEMFDHFIVFFTFVFQLNAFIYSIPLTIRLKNDPIINIFLQIGLISVFKSYPSIGETGLYLSLLPILGYLFPLMRNFLVYSCMILASTVLAPIMFYLWLGSGGGNANFYFAITLVSSIGQIFLLVDILYANCKREFIIKNGWDMPRNKDNSLAIFSLE